LFVASRRVRYEQRPTRGRHDNAYAPKAGLEKGATVFWQGRDASRRGRLGSTETEGSFCPASPVPPVLLRWANAPGEPVNKAAGGLARPRRRDGRGRGLEVGKLPGERSAGGNLLGIVSNLRAKRGSRGIGVAHGLGSSVVGPTAPRGKRFGPSRRTDRVARTSVADAIKIHRPAQAEVTLSPKLPGRTRPVDPEKRRTRGDPDRRPRPPNAGRNGAGFGAVPAPSGRSMLDGRRGLRHEAGRRAQARSVSRTSSRATAA